MNETINEVNFYAPCGTMWHQDINFESSNYRDRYNVWIVTTMLGGKRYFKHVQISGQDRETGAGLLKLCDELKKCAESTEGMTVVEPGGVLPYNDSK